MRVLAVDDDEMMRDILARLLSRLGVEAVLASCGESALAAIKDAMGDATKRFDAAFVDLSMPWKQGGADCEGGLVLAKAIRAEEAAAGSRRLILVALTGADCRGATGAATVGAAAFDRIMQKPVGLEDLRAELASL